MIYLLLRDLLEDLGVLDVDAISAALAAMASTSSLIILIALTPYSFVVQFGEEYERER